jgi:hypothetical protein
MYPGQVKNLRQQSGSLVLGLGISLMCSYGTLDTWLAVSFGKCGHSRLFADRACYPVADDAPRIEKKLAEHWVYNRVFR